MSDEESFVILGSSPMSSLDIVGLEAREQTFVQLTHSDRPGSRFSSLKSSEIKNLKNAQESVPQTHQASEVIEMPEVEKHNEEMVASKLWSTTASHVEVEENIRQLCLEDCALKSALNLKAQQKTLTKEGQPIKTIRSSSADSSLAANFIMGEIDSDTLKSSVYSQFPSIALEASAEDITKLQNMVAEYTQLKSTIKKANQTMKAFYQSSLQWKQKIHQVEEDYKNQLNNCTKEIMELRKEIVEMDKNFRIQIEALQIARKKDREEYIQEISDKSALVENMRAEIVKLEQQQLASFEIMLTQAEQEESKKPFADKNPLDIKIKELQTQLSELLASNLELKDMQKQYVDELNCLKVNLTAAEELISKNQSEIAKLQSLIHTKDKQIEKFEESLTALNITLEEQKEHVQVLEAQNEVHRADFEMEKQSRETAVKEKQQMLQDLRSLQKKNQELIEAQQKLTDSYQRRFSSATASSEASIVPSPPQPALESRANTHVCPICNKGFKALHLLLNHVNDCVDKN